jgi:hypothetical protein
MKTHVTLKCYNINYYPPLYGPQSSPLGSPYQYMSYMPGGFSHNAAACTTALSAANRVDGGFFPTRAFSSS